MNEKTLERKLREGIRQRGGLALKIWAVSFAGLPDRLVLMTGGRAYFAEIKTQGKKPTLQQSAVHSILRDLGFNVTVIDSADTLNDFMKMVSPC